MDWEFLAVAPMPPGGHLLHGCWLEAERADRAAMGLDELRAILDRSFHGHMMALTEEIRVSSQMLRELAGHSGRHESRTPIVANHLNLLLPCMSKTLRDITDYYNDKTISREMRWRKMYHEMMSEAGGISVPQRFFLYNHFLRMLLYLLTKSKHFDPGQLEMLRHKILDLRQRRGIPAPAQKPAAGPSLDHHHRPSANRQSPPPPPHPSNLPHDVSIVPLPRERAHWCQAVFALPLSSRTDIPGPEKSRVGPPLAPPWDPNRPSERKVLMRQSFDSQKMCVRFILDAKDIPFVDIRTYSGGTPWYAWRGHHEVRLFREGNTLILSRRSRYTAEWKVWAMLSFVTWEELVLFHCTFTALKACNPLAPTMQPFEYQLEGEQLLFRAHIIDDGYSHCLTVYREERSGGVRLQAAVQHGELVQCPVWTAFVTHISASPNWLVRKTRHVFHVMDIQLYVFCQTYSESRMRRNRLNAFEINFSNENAASRFAAVFSSHQVTSDMSGDNVEDGDAVEQRHARITGHS